MSVEYGSAEAWPAVCAVYVCRCGRSATRYGTGAGRPPARWLVVAVGGRPEHVCPECAPAFAGAG